MMFYIIINESTKNELIKKNQKVKLLNHFKKRFKKYSIYFEK